MACFAKNPYTWSSSRSRSAFRSPQRRPFSTPASVDDEDRCVRGDVLLALDFTVHPPERWQLQHFAAELALNVARQKEEGSGRLWSGVKTPKAQRSPFRLWCSELVLDVGV